MDNRASWIERNRVFSPFQRTIVVSCVAVLHVAAYMAWLKLAPHAVMQKREMEVVMLVAPAVSHAKKAPLQQSPRKIRIPQPHVKQPAPEPPLPVEEIIQEREIPIAVTGSPATVAEPVVQSVAQEMEPDFEASYINKRLIYPQMARRMGIQGRVVLDVEVLADGLCGEADVAQSSGHEMLDQAALESVRAWHFAPARHGTQAVTRWFKVPITFSLKDDEA